MRSLAALIVVAILAGGTGDASAYVIDFEGYPSGTQITDQYLPYGVLFSGYPPGQSPPRIEDYGTGSYGKVLRSYDWYSAMQVQFVDPLNPSVYLPVSHIELDNPIDTEVDYLVVEVFDASGQLLYSYTSTSPERVVIDLGAPVAAYMILDDSANTAYVIDNLEAYSPIVFSDGFESGDVSAWSATVP
ncbi:MAG TPA: hypothetical protein PKJ99_14735 [Thermoanaerobaculales bacterium]|nr:hypothetical protein [Thermoanaerobaculales bacterium]HPA81197.1 hypothetical protein [Thermoanaerobaculales bacterium]HQL29341.1 hypothetical protein [Thermoanaerobaculales bacterium]HQN97593.1 hypothetical protein [Thermoanaerobaculales bacterium]HQP43866.1 hypothetical protein [Thermoanaerobaculales bacterium]